MAPVAAPLAKSLPGTRQLHLPPAPRCKPLARRPCCRAAAVSSTQTHGRVLGPPTSGDLLREGVDPGSWAFSPEWMGTQDGGWGHNAGETVFDADSAHGNGRVWVTRHFASRQDPVFRPALRSPAEPAEWFQEWRVLRFNDATRQSVARVTLSRNALGGVETVQHADCMAFLYMKTLAALIAAHVGLAPEGSSLAAAAQPTPGSGPASSGRQSCRVLCVGLGGGSLPLFLAHHFPGMSIDVVELDGAVIAAARQAMGFPAEDSPSLRLHQGDAVRWLAEQQAAGGPPFDIVIVDAFDGDNDIPDAFVELSGPFLPCLARALHPGHGLALLNAHRGELPPLWQQVALKLAGQRWLDPIVTPLARNYRDALLPAGGGLAYMLGVGKQYNTVVAVARGQHLAQLQQPAAELSAAAARVGQAAGFRFPAAPRAGLDFLEVPSTRSSLD